MTPLLCLAVADQMVEHEAVLEAGSSGRITVDKYLELVL